MIPEFATHAERIQALCRRFGILHLAAFGSALRSDFDPSTSDVDLFAVFSSTSEPGYANRYLDFAEALEALFGRRVDLLTPGGLRNRRLAESIRRDAVTLYDAKEHQAA